MTFFVKAVKVIKLHLNFPTPWDICSPAKGGIDSEVSEVFFWDQ